ncbi:chromate transporter [Alkaliphilus sp. MSJ-5]|uniref:Chromate transporter n=1 Tax=Alkaliphilus flagellatus TaxID=2841507 RepID=A0ABS6G1U4_9FIRM|nr:chromate transporter [Alkaliphilus flagellatus]MBU5676449.1 chromate transporter [Alkaliphilus flagellatus]
MKDLWELFTMFFRIGAFTFGGGYAMLPIIQNEVVEKRKWATDDEIIDYYAIGQCTPGVIAVNTATFIGYKKKGIIGGITATLGVVLPSLILITIIATFFKHFQDYKVVQYAFGGIRVGVVALIANTVIKMLKQTAKDRIGIAIFISAFLIIAFIDISPIVVIVMAALIGIFKGKNVEVKEDDIG